MSQDEYNYFTKGIRWRYQGLQLPRFEIIEPKTKTTYGTQKSDIQSFKAIGF